MPGVWMRNHKLRSRDPLTGDTLAPSSPAEPSPNCVVEQATAATEETVSIPSAEEMAPVTETEATEEDMETEVTAEEILEMVAATTETVVATISEITEVDMTTAETAVPDMPAPVATIKILL